MRPDSEIDNVVYVNPRHPHRRPDHGINFTGRLAVKQ